VKHERKEKRHEIKIEDNGKWHPSTKYWTNIFNHFLRLNQQARVRVWDSLAIDIIKAHGGEIKVGKNKGR
jgi:signal transduction histidine kinase